MKKVKNILKGWIGGLVLFLILGITNVVAAGSASLTYNGPSNVNVGDTFTIELKVSNIVGDPLAAVGTKVVFDATYLEYVSGTGATSPISFDINKRNYKLAGIMGASGEGIEKDQTIFTFQFKALQQGTTTLSFSDVDVSDWNSAAVTVNSPSKTITIGVSTPKSSNANLSSLSVSNQSISPTFNKDTLSYNLTVPNGTNSITINATKEDSTASITGTGTKTLNVGSNSFPIVVTAEDGTKKTYTINVTREGSSSPDTPSTPDTPDTPDNPDNPDNPNTPGTSDKSSDNSLKDLQVNGYTISPNFQSNVETYELSIPNNVTSLDILATKNDDKATVEIIGNTNLQEGENTVSVVVTAEDGTKKTYTIKVNREEHKDLSALDSDTTLKSLYIGGYTLNPTFNPNTNVYTINVGEKVGGLDVEAIPNSSTSKVEIQGNSGWNYGMNVVTIKVTAENGSTNTYVVNVNRKNPNSGSSEPQKSQDNYLSDLIIEGVEIKPGFDKEVSNYTVTVPYDYDKLNIKYTANDKAKVEIIGNENLKVNEVNTIQIKVTAEDGSTRIYTVNAIRSALKSDNNLKSLVVDGFNLSPTFNKDTLNYHIKVKSGTDKLDITAIPENEKATVEIIGNDNLETGKNVVLIKVTDENGFTKIYQIDVEKPSFSILGMSLGQFLMFGLLALSVLGILTYLIFMRNKKIPKAPVVTQPTPVAPQPSAPIIDFKPEFNFGSRNNTDDDVVEAGGILNQGNEIEMKEKKEPKKLIEAEDAVIYEEEVYDPYDEHVTKDEVLDALKEGMETKNVDKLNMLLKQEELNKMKKKIKEKETKRRGEK